MKRPFEVRILVEAESPEAAANSFHDAWIPGLFVTDPHDPLKQESRFVAVEGGFKYVDATTEDFDPAKAAEQHAKNLFHTLWGRAKACDSEEAPYVKDEWMQLQMTLHDLGVDV